MALMVSMSTAVSGLKSEQTALDVIANNIANVNTTGYKSQTVTFSDILSQTISAATSGTATTGSTNATQVGLGVSVASTDTDMTVGSSSSTSNWTDVALTGSGYFIVQTGANEYAYTRNGSMSVDDDGNLTIDGYIVCGWEEYTLDEDGNIVYTTSSEPEAINLYSDSYAGNKYTLTPEVTTSSTISGNLDSDNDVADTATGLTAIGDTTDLDFDATTEITVYDSQGNDYDVTVSLKKCAVEGDITTWYYELSADDTTISPSSGYIAFDADGNLVTSATTLSAAVQDTAGYASSNISVGTAVATGTYSVAVTGTSGAYTVTLTYPDGTTSSVSSTTGAATFGSGTSAITIKAPTTISTGTSSFTVTGGTTTAATASSTSNTAGYATSNITTSSDVAAASYIITTTSAASGGSGYDITVYASDGTTVLGSATDSTDGSGTITLSTGGTITLTAPTSFSIGSTTITTTSTTTRTAAVADAGYAYSNVAIGTGSAEGDYTITAAQNSDGSTWDITLTYPDGTTKTVTGSSDGSATFTTTAGTITLSAPDSIQAGTTTFTVDSTSYTFADSTTITVTTPASAGTEDITFDLDFSDVQTSNATDSLADDTDGYSAGTAQSYSISSDGTIYCTYDNGETISIGQIALAMFTNAEGLTKAGDNLYTESLSSGDLSYVVAGEGGTGTMTSYALELSNVDLAEQFSAMLVSQRSYQANSKIISASDEMVQSLINMVG
ncbi:flagellar hook-basal body complex protein [Sporomusa sp. KB1]|jgi:flagellar hook protein FlgE|uniref:flagellar hook-basal body complex protein n=1 Tax=Sporomusa sp. KB1 TaxID=943346 RepID=UPI0011A70C88|nr:flagellar hook-basal body complex protein [Sporomusa sp. KB1]TWH47381.1 flagellar hook protein FlgE [Sporomusa sp. KB1]